MLCIEFEVHFSTHFWLLSIPFRILSSAPRAPPVPPRPLLILFLLLRLAATLSLEMESADFATGRPLENLTPSDEASLVHKSLLLRRLEIEGETFVCEMQRAFVACGPLCG